MVLMIMNYQDFEDFLNYIRKDKWGFFRKVYDPWLKSNSKSILHLSETKTSGRISKNMYLKNLHRPSQLNRETMCFKELSII